VAGKRRIPKDPIEHARRQAAAVSRRCDGLSVTPIVCVHRQHNEPFEARGVVVCSAADLPEVLWSLPSIISASPELVQAFARERLT
jgi:hypothetical protein